MNSQMPGTSNRWTRIAVSASMVLLAFVLGALLFGGESDSKTGTAGSGHDHAADREATMWTCSMHPQIQLPKAGQCPICFMDLIPVESGGGDELGERQLRMSETAKQLASLVTTPVVRATARREIRMPGRLEFDETRVVYITAWVPGRLDKLYVDFTGEKVKAGQPLAEIYSPELIAAQEELLQAHRASRSQTTSGNTLLASTVGKTLESAREKLRLYGLTEQQVENILASDKASRHLTLSAPAGGVVVHKDAKEGLYVSTGTRIYTIADLQTLWVRLQAYESDLPWLKEGQPMSFTSRSFPGKRFQAVIDFVDPVVDPSTRTVAVRAVVDNSSGRLKPQMFVTGIVLAQTADIESMAAGTDQLPLLIPASAPLITGKRAVVYVEIPNDDGPLFEGREIVLGPKVGEQYIVEEGLSEGDLVVSNGAFKLDSELQIQARPSMMSPEGGRAPAGHDHGGHAVPQSDGGETATDSVHPTDSVHHSELAMQPGANRALTPLYDAYFVVQMALANDNLEDATKGYGSLAQATEQIDVSAIGEDADKLWRKLGDRIVTASRSGRDAREIAEARDSFYDLSKAVIQLHDIFSHHSEGSFYLTFCPMARGNQGAYWLQQQDTVWNSFYGDMMLRCGEIKTELPSHGADSE